jgi:hypothetical protein
MTGHDPASMWDRRSVRTLVGFFPNQCLSLCFPIPLCGRSSSALAGHRPALQGKALYLPSNNRYMPHFADSGGYTTQFILYSGTADRSSSGVIRFFSQSGQALGLTLR